MYEIQVVTALPKLVHPDMVANLPGIKLESDLPRAKTRSVPDILQDVAAARLNAGLDDEHNTNIELRRVNEAAAIDGEQGVYWYQGVLCKAENGNKDHDVLPDLIMADERDSCNDNSDDKDDGLMDKDVIEDDIPIEDSHGIKEPVVQQSCAGRISVPRKFLEPNLEPGKEAYGNSRDLGVNFPLVGRSSATNGGRTYFQNAGFVYSTKQGVVHLNIDDDAPDISAMTKEESAAHMVGVIFAQHFSLSKGIKIFGDKADITIQKELSQIHTMDTYKSFMKTSLSYGDRRKALVLLMFITEKGNVDIKARKVVDGSNQRTYDGYDKLDGLSPIVATNSVFLTGVVDAHKLRAIVIIDIANAFLYTYNDERVLMLLRGKLAEMVVQVDPSLYSRYVTYSTKGLAMLYVKLSMALYGMLRAALFIYKRLRSDLEGMGLVINPYDPCVANKMVNGHKITVCWHFDNIKVSHKDENVITAFVENLVDTYWEKTTISRGKVHNYLGLDMDWPSVPGTLIVTVIKYLQKVIEKFPELLCGSKASPAGDHLFTVREDGNRKLQCEEMAS